MDDIFEIQLETMANGGNALGRHEGRVVFIPYTIPGEIVEAQLVEDKGRIAFAQGKKLIEASVDRVFPACDHFGPGRCGGCQWQHISPTAQLLLKQDVLADQLERLGGIHDPDVRAVIPSPSEWGYNHRMTFVVSDGGEMGFYGTEHGQIIAIDLCHVLHPDLMSLYQQLDIDPTGFKSITLVQGGQDDQMVILEAAEEEAPELEIDIPASVNMILPDNQPMNLAGNTHVVYAILGRQFRVTAGSYFRANVPGVSLLITEVLNAVGGAENVLDLYAGVGVLGAFIAEKANNVAIVESFPPAATDADENTADLDNVDVIEGSVEDVLAAAEDEYDVAVLDPPARGLSTDTLDSLGELLNLKRLVYISDDAATLARDAKRLLKHGYSFTYAQPFDLAPQTFQVTTVVVFDRKDKKQRKDRPEKTHKRASKKRSSAA